MCKIKVEKLHRLKSGVASKKARREGGVLVSSPAAQLGTVFARPSSASHLHFYWQKIGPYSYNFIVSAWPRQGRYEFSLAIDHKMALVVGALTH